MKLLGVCLSVRPIICPTICRCGGFAAMCHAGRRHRSTAAAARRTVAAVPQHGTQQQIVLSSKCVQCHIV